MSKNSKRTKAATATNGHVRAQTPDQAVAIAQGRGLAEVAAQLADLENLYTLTIKASYVARKEGKCEGGVYLPKEIAASNAAHLLDNVTKRAHAITDTLQDLLVQMEPQTLGETLSLLLVYNQQMASFFSDLREFHDFNLCEAMQERESKLDRTREALIRGLVGAGAKSPLLDNYATPTEELVSWGEMRSNAEAAAKRYPPHAKEAAE